MNLYNKRNNCDDIFSALSQPKLASCLNPIAIPLDSKYYFSTIKISRKLPITQKNKLSQNLLYRNIFRNNFNDKYIKKNHSAISLLNNSNRKSKELDEYKIKESSQSIPKIKNKNISNLKQIKIIKRENSVDTINVKMQMMDHYIRKLKDKMNQTKFKFFQIVKHNNQNECNQFKTKIEKFNLSLKHFFKSNYYIKKNLEYHQRFHFGPNYLNIGNNSTRHHMELNTPENIIKLNSKLVLNLLNDEDKKLIANDPYYFFKDNKYLYKLTNIKMKSLLDRLKEEEKFEKKENDSYDDLDIEKYYKKSKSKSITILNKRRNIPKNIKSKTIEITPFIDKQYIDKIVNKDLNFRLKHYLKSRKNPVEKELKETFKKLSAYKKKENLFVSNKFYGKTYHIRTNKDYFKPFSLMKNKERLIKDKFFSEKVSKKNVEDDKDKIIITKYKRELEGIYNKDKNDIKIN